MTIEPLNEARVARKYPTIQWFGASASGELRAENDRLRARLKECEAVTSRYAIMLREGDHRIKNSLAIVSSLMQLQARREESPSASLALRGAAARVQSVARIHDALQLSDGRDVVDLGAVLEAMCQGLQVMAGDPLAVEVLVHAQHIEVPVTLAQPLVLAVNELVVNALRHAFPDGRAGTVLVSVTRVGEELRVVVADDGIGLPGAYSLGRGYGMKLVRAMATQVGAELEVENRGGARFALAVQMSEAELQPVD